MTVHGGVLIDKIMGYQNEVSAKAHSLPKIKHATKIPKGSMVEQGPGRKKIKDWDLSKVMVRDIHRAVACRSRILARL